MNLYCPATDVRSGYVHLYTSAVRFFGYAGRSWSNVSINYSSATNAKAYHFDFNASDVYPSAGPASRYYGHPVRCLVYYVILYPKTKLAGMRYEAKSLRTKLARMQRKEKVKYARKMYPTYVFLAYWNF